MITRKPLTAADFPVYYPHPRTVEIVRLSGDDVGDHAYLVTAYDLFGQKLAERRYSHGTRRRQLALEQAQRYADAFYLHFDGRIFD